MTKRLTKSSNNQMISGVCGGIAEFFNIDASIVRIIWVILAFGGGTGIIAYIACAIILPSAPPDDRHHPPYSDPNNSYDPYQNNDNGPRL